MQVVYATYNSTTTNTSSWADTGLSASITPKYSTSKILVLAMNNVAATNSNGVNSVAYFDTLRGSTVLVHTRFQIGNALASGTNAIVVGPVTIQYLDSPATTSSVTYQTYIAANQFGQTAYNGTGTAVLTLLEIL